MRPSPSNPPSFAVAAVKAVVSMLLLVTFVAGVPVLLALVTPMVWAEVGDDVLHLLDTDRPDNAGVFLLALVAVAWIAWAHFTVSVLVELPAQLKGRTARPRRGFALSQGMAASLIGAVLVLLPTGTALATPSTAVAVSATATPEADTSQHQGKDQRHGTRQQAGQHRVYAVQDARESLISIASSELGDDSRFQEIADLNDGRQMPDGSVYTPDQFLKKGWTLLLPQAPDQTRASSSSSSGGGMSVMSAGTQEDSPPTRETEDREHVVESGDTLWEISEEHYGDGTHYTEVYDANRDTLDSPDLIYPGHTLQVPQASAAPEHGTDDRQDDPEQGPEQDEDDRDQGSGEGGAHDTEQPGSAEKPEHDNSKSDGQQDEQDAAPPESSPTSEASATPSPGSEQRDDVEASSPASTVSDDDSGDTMLAVAAGTGLLASGLVGAVWTRRVVQQRRRRRGRRIAMPTGRAAQTEQDLRAAAPPVDPGRLDGLLRTAAAGLAAAGRALPELRAVVLGDEVELHLATAAEAVPPFTAEDGGHTWVCPVTATGDASGEDVDPPYPCLVALGGLEDGRLVLVDLEQVGVLHLTGPYRHEVARSLAVEAAVSQVAEHLTVVVPEQVTPRLADHSDRVTAAHSPATALEGLRTHHAAQQRALDTLGLSSLRQARLGQAGAGGWTPHIVVTDEQWTSTDVTQLGELVASTPRTATAVVTTSETDLPSKEAGWVLHADGEQVQLPHGLVCSLSTMDDQTYEDIVELLSTADSDHDVPADTPPYAPYGALWPEQDRLDEEAEEPGTAGTSASPTNVGVGAALFTQLSDLDDGDDGDEADGGHTAPALEEPAVEQSPDTTASPTAVPASWPRHAETAELAEPESGDHEVKGVSDGQGGPPLGLSKQPDFRTAQPPRPDMEPSSSAGSRQEAVDAEGLSAPLVRVLGPVEVIGAAGEVETKRIRAATELTAWLLYHPGSDREALEAALWRGREVKRRSVTELISRTRKWLGTDGAGEYYLPVIAETPDARYELHGAVTSDWHQFLDLVARGERTSGPGGARALRQALELVRGTPFSGVPAQRYVWAEPLLQEMVAAVVDAAELLSERYQVAGEPREALWASVKGLESAPEAEQLWRAKFIALHALGDLEGLRRAAEDLEELNDTLGVEEEDATIQVLRDLMSRA